MSLMFPMTTSILLVDDMKGVRILITRLLKQMGFENIQEANDGQEAIHILQSSVADEKPIGLIIADLRMPGVDGLQLLDFVRQNSKLEKMPFLMLSAESDKDAIVNAVRAGVDDYIIKPASLVSLKQKLEKVYQRLNGV